jgi:hypothetical protein
MFSSGFNSMLKLTVTLLIQINVNDASLLQNNLLTCIAAISDRYFKPGSTMVVSLPSEEYFMTVNVPHKYIMPNEGGGQYISGNHSITQLLHQLHNTVKWPIIISQPNSVTTSHCVHDKHKFYILWASVNLTGQLKYLKSYSNAWNPRAHFLVVLERVVADPHHLVREILEEMSQWKILNVIVLVQFDIVPNTIDVYTWFPYQQPSGECGRIQDVILLNQWGMDNWSRFLRNISLFPNKIPSNLGQCPIVASTMPFEPYIIPNTMNQLNINYEDGLEIQLFHFVTDAMNLNVKFKPPPPENELWGEKLVGGTWTGIYADLVYERADIAFCGMSLRSKWSPYVDGTTSYINGGVVWVVPCAQRLPRWKSIFLVFLPSVWLLIFVAMFISAVIMLHLDKFAVQQHKKLKLSYGSITDCLTYTWAVLLGIAVPEMPHNIPLRLFFILWVSYCLAVSTVFQTFVTSYLINPGMRKQINSLNEILETGMDYGFYPGLDSAFQDKSDWQTVEVMAHRKVCTDITNCLEIVYESMEFATLMDRLHVYYLNTHTFLDKSGVPMLCTIEHDFIESYKAFLLTKGNHLLEQFNRFIQIAIEAGLVGKWWQDILTTSRTKSATLQKHSLPDDYSVLLLIHLQGAYYLLLLGHCVALISFLTEVLYHRYYTQ